MKIVFYSTNSNVFNDKTFHIDIFPSVNAIFQQFCEDHSEHEFYVVTQKPCFFLPSSSFQADSDGSSFSLPTSQNKSGAVYVLPQEATVKDMADCIAALTPDLAIPLTFWVDPFDWLTINDTLVAEQLQAKGIKTIAHSLDTGMTCFNKTKTHEKLKALGFPLPAALTVDHDMYFCAGSNKKVIHNVYKDYIASKIRKLGLPLIIKETVGVSSYGAAVVNTYGEAICYLNSKRNNSDRIVEEYIPGHQFGCEIYGVPGNYTILPPVEFSLNQYGITSPKLSAKYGPILEAQADAIEGDVVENLPNLYKMLTALSEDLKFQGVAQVDLVQSEDGNWYVIEINPRLSGMSYTYAAMCGMSLYEMIFQTCVEGKKIITQEGASALKKVLNIKLPVITLETCKKIKEIRGVAFVHLTNNEEAKQEREKGYTEIIITGNSLSEIKENLAVLKKTLPDQDFSTVDKFIQ